MKELTGNLQRDAKELLGESVGLVTGLFKRGVCTVRAVADKWKAFARDISGAVDALMKPPFAEGGPEAPAPALSLNTEAEPIVTITESMNGKLFAGQQMTLSEANELIGQLDQEYQEADIPSAKVKIKIDFTRNGQTDRYWLPLELGAGGNLLEQMKARLDYFHADPKRIERLFDDVSDRAAFRAELMPFVNESINKLSTGLLHYFHRHCDIAALRQQFDAQASLLPEKQQQAFRETAERTIVSLRRAVNTGAPQSQPNVERPHREQAAAPSRQADRERTRSSVRTHIGQIKENQTRQAAPHKGRVRPRQPGR